MKALITVSILLAGLPSFASSLTCSSQGSNGYVIRIAEDQKSGTIAAKNESGERPLEFGKLRCYPVAAQAQVPDYPQTFLNCTSADVADAGYNISFSAGGFIFEITADVSTQWFGGTVPVESNILCNNDQK